MSKHLEELLPAAMVAFLKAYDARGAGWRLPISQQCRAQVLAEVVPDQGIERIYLVAV